YGGKSNKGGFIQGVHHFVDALQERAHSRGAPRFRQGQGVAVQLLQIRARAKAAWPRAGNNAGAGGRGKPADGACKPLEIRQGFHSNLVQRLAVQRHFHDAVPPLPPQRLSAKFLDHEFPPAATACFLYNCSISSRKHALMASRRNFPFAVSKPLSGVNASSRIRKLRTWR